MLMVDERDGEIVPRLDVFKEKEAAELHKILSSWTVHIKKIKEDGIAPGQYDNWRYYNPKYDITEHWHKVTLLQGLSDMPVKGINNIK
jgi:hypothetical protein